MSDEPMAPNPEPAVPRPPAKLIVAGCGGLAVLGVVVLLIWGFTSLLGGLSLPSAAPVLKSAEKAAESRLLFEAQTAFLLQSYRAEQAEREAGKRRELLAWLADKSDEEKKIKEGLKCAEAFRKHEKELRNPKVGVVDAKPVDGMKEVRVKLTGKQLEKDGDGFKLTDLTVEETYRLTEIEGEWRIKR